MKKGLMYVLCGFLLATTVAGFAALITKSKTFVTGETIQAGDFNTLFDTIYNEFNGSISNANISGSAAIDDTKLDLVSIAQNVTFNSALTAGTTFTVQGIGFSVGRSSFVVTSNGEVLVATTTAVSGSPFLVESNNAQDSTPIVLRNANATNGNDSRFSYRSKDSAGNEDTFVIISASYTDHTSTSEDADIVFFLMNAGSLVRTMVIESSGTLHVNPPAGTTADAIVEISSGGVLGGGSAHAASFASHSSRSIKDHVEPLDRQDVVQILKDVRHYDLNEFEYRNPETGRGDGRKFRGHIYETAPESLKGRHETISLNDRLFNSEVVIMELLKKIDELEYRLQSAGVP